jgi:hypothetical protein
MTAPIRYQRYLLRAVSTLEFGGTYRARAALTAVKDGRPRSQRFMDFESFATKAAADERAIEGGKLWIDAQTRIASAAFPTEFDTIV